MAVDLGGRLVAQRLLRRVANKPTPSPTSTPVTVTSITQAEYEAACGTAPWGQQAYRVGNLYFSQGFALTYPSRKLPDGIPLKPLQLTDPNGEHSLDDQIPPTPLVNPTMDQAGSGFVAWVCNPAKSEPATVRAVALRIDSFAAYSAHADS